MLVGDEAGHVQAVLRHWCYSRVCHPWAIRRPSLLKMVINTVSEDAAQIWAAGLDEAQIDALVTELYRSEGANLVRLARFFVDDRTAAEDLVQEAFIRLARSLHRVREPERITAYLRSIVLNLARDHNRRGLVSLRHQLPSDPEPPSVEDQITVRDDQRQVIDALRELPVQQRNALVLRYYLDLGISEIAGTMGISPNSVKTHLKRGLRSLEAQLGGRP